MMENGSLSNRQITVRLPTMDDVEVEEDEQALDEYVSPSPSTGSGISAVSPSSVPPLAASSAPLSSSSPPSSSTADQQRNGAKAHLDPITAEYRAAFMDDAPVRRLAIQYAHMLELERPLSEDVAAVEATIQANLAQIDQFQLMMNAVRFIRLFICLFLFEY